MKVVYDWLKKYVGDDMPGLEKLDELLTFHAFEIDGIEKAGNHNVIDVKVLPDRSSDCLSHRGVAHELATLIGKPLSYDPFKETVSLTPVTRKITVSIENPDNCRRFGAAHITGITIKESPEWLKERLKALGQRPINNVVDATNYVMLSLGQPLHAYDATKFPHKDDVWQFGVRMARDGEEVMTLSKETYTLKNNVQLIVDSSTDTPVGIAGVKGGAYAEIDSTTTDVILEAANFNPQVTRRATQSIRLQTDASKRFENNLSPELIPYALHACVALILETASGICEGYVDVYPQPIKNIEVMVRKTHMEALLGVMLTHDTVRDILTRLDFVYTEDGDSWTVTAPFERTDVTIPEDVIAEIGRIYGYEHVKAVVPSSVPLIELNTRHYYSEQIRTFLVAQGFSEVITSSFRKKDVIELQNALASDKGCLRSALKENIREALDRNMPNIDLLGLQSIQIFEIGTVFNKEHEEGGIAEHMSLALGVRTKQQGYVPKDDARLEEVATLLKESLGVEIEWSQEKGVFECNLTKILTQLSMPPTYGPYAKSPDVTYVPFSVYPFIARDIALWTPLNTDAHTIESHIREKAGTLLTRLSLFDEFKKDGRISYAFRLIFQSFERTLTDDEINAIMEEMYTSLKEKGFEIR